MQWSTLDITYSANIVKFTHVHISSNITVTRSSLIFTTPIHGGPRKPNKQPKKSTNWSDQKDKLWTKKTAKHHLDQLQFGIHPTHALSDQSSQLLLVSLRHKSTILTTRLSLFPFSTFSPLSRTYILMCSCDKSTIEHPCTLSGSPIDLKVIASGEPDYRSPDCEHFLHWLFF